MGGSPMRFSRTAIRCLAFILSIGVRPVGAETRAECLRSAQARLIACYEACLGSESEAECRRACKEYYAQQVQSCADKPKTQEHTFNLGDFDHRALVSYRSAIKKRSAPGSLAAQASSLCTAPGART